MGEAKQFFATLDIRRVKLAYETPEEQAKADKLNEEIKHLGVQTCRMAYDWGFRLYAAKHPREVQPLKSGDLVKIFKSVSKGELAWKGTVDFDCKEYHHGLQKGLDAKKWSDMFLQCLPARMERDGKVIFGALEPFCETGTEGVIWSVHEYGKAGYDGLNCLKNGDRLTVYSSVSDGEVEWEGPLDFGPEKVEKVGWSEVLRQTNHMNTEDWLQLNWQRRPVAITPK